MVNTRWETFVQDTLEMADMFSEDFLTSHLYNQSGGLAGVAEELTVNKMWARQLFDSGNSSFS